MFTTMLTLDKIDGWSSLRAVGNTGCNILYEKTGIMMQHNDENLFGVFREVTEHHVGKPVQVMHLRNFWVHFLLKR